MLYRRLRPDGFLIAQDHLGARDRPQDRCRPRQMHYGSGSDDPRQLLLDDLVVVRVQSWSRSCCSASTLSWKVVLGQGGVSVLPLQVRCTRAHVPSASWTATSSQ